MADTKWTIKGREFVNCNCTYGCPCQFDALPTHGFCQAVAGFEIAQGQHGPTKLDGLRFVGIFRWPGAIHEGKGEAAVVVDERATEAQRGSVNPFILPPSSLLCQVILPPSAFILFVI